MKQHLNPNDKDSHKTKPTLDKGNGRRCRVTQNEHILEGKELSAVGQTRMRLLQPPAVESHFQMQETE
jgi:hypothetical protein